MRRLWVLIAFTTVLTACRDSGVTEESTAIPSTIATTAATPAEPSTATTFLLTTSTTSSTTTSTTLAPLPPLPEPLAGQVEELIEITQELRGLQFLEAPAIQVLTPEEVSERRREGLEEDLDREKLVPESAFYALVGIVPEETDLYEFYTDFYSTGTLAYYDLEEQRLIVPLTAETLNEYEKWILVHELTHALMDQHFPEVANIYEEHSDDGDFDRIGAVLGLLEGEAVLIQSLYLDGLDSHARSEVVRVSRERASPTFNDAPYFFRELIRFPYTAGSLLMVDLYRRGGVEALNQAFDRPPDSTEQVLHPDRYVALEPPVELEALSLTLEGYELFEEGTWGERGWRLLLGQHLDHSDAAAAAQGWGGDHYQILWDGEAGEIAAAFQYQGDSFGDASEIAGALGRFIEAAMAVGSGTVVDTTIEWEGESFAHLARTGDTLILVVASNVDDGKALVSQLGG